MANDGDAFHAAAPLKYRAVADDLHRRRGIGAAFARELAACGPRAAFENLRERQGLGVEPESLSHAVGEAVEQCHRQCAPFHYERRGDLMLALCVLVVAK